MLMRIIQAVLVAIVVGFCLAVLLGPVLIMLKAPIAVWAGGVFVDWGWPMGVIAGLWFFFFGGSLGGPWRLRP